MSSRLEPPPAPGRPAHRDLPPQLSEQQALVLDPLGVPPTVYTAA
jgi:hypothetical protein